MAYKNEIDMENFAALLSNAVDKVKTHEDVDVLNELKKVYKRTVPFSLRTYVAAYFAKEILSHRGGRHYGGRYERRDSYPSYDERHQNRSDRFKSAQSGYGTNEEHVPRERVQIDDDKAVTIFVSMGRNRRVFPRDLIGLLINAGGLARERIGNIRVLASYSFVQLYKEDADAVIEKIDGYEYRGRKLAVSYSKTKDITCNDDINVSDNENEIAENNLQDGNAPSSND